MWMETLIVVLLLVVMVVGWKLTAYLRRVNSQLLTIGNDWHNLNCAIDMFRKMLSDIGSDVKRRTTVNYDVSVFVETLVASHVDDFTKMLSEMSDAEITYIVRSVSGRVAASVLGLVDRTRVPGIIQMIEKTGAVTDHDLRNVMSRLRQIIPDGSSTKYTNRENLNQIAEIIMYLPNRHSIMIDDALMKRASYYSLTMDALVDFDSAAIQVLLRYVEKDKVCLALKGSSDVVKRKFQENMSSRAWAMVSDDMDALGPVLIRDVDDAQYTICRMVQELISSGQIADPRRNTEREGIVY